MSTETNDSNLVFLQEYLEILLNKIGLEKNSQYTAFNFLIRGLLEKGDESLLRFIIVYF